MAVYPNSDCALFCYWMLNVSWQTLTAPRLDTINTVYSAAQTGSSVTDQEFNNFTQITSWRYPLYLVWRDNQFPYSTPPVGTPVFWFNFGGLTTNNTNSFGTVDVSGNISKIKDILGSSIEGTQVSYARNGSLLHSPYSGYFGNSIGLNISNNQNYTLSNSLTTTQNITGLTAFIIAQGLTSATNNVILGYSIGTASTTARFGAATTSAGLWLLFGRRLDADSSFSLTGHSSLSAPSITCLRQDYTNKTGTIFSNGVITAQSTNLGTAGNTSNTASLAAYFGGYNNAQTFPGFITDCLVFQNALSDTDVVTISDWLNSMRNVY